MTSAATLILVIGEPLTLIRGLLNRCLQDFVLDTGACVSVLDARAVSGMTLTPTTVTLKAAGNNSLQTIGTLTTTVKIDTLTIEHKFYVVKGLNLEATGILGKDFYKSHQLYFSANPLSLTIGTHPIRIVSPLDNKTGILEETPNNVEHVVVVGGDDNLDAQVTDSVSLAPPVSTMDQHSDHVDSDDPDHDFGLPVYPTEPNYMEPYTLGVIEARVRLPSQLSELDIDHGIFTPYDSNSPSSCLIPGIVGLRKEEGSKDYRMVMPFLNFSDQQVEVNRELLGKFEPCSTLDITDEGLDVLLINKKVGGKKDKEREKRVRDIVKGLFPNPNSKEHKALLTLALKYPRVFALEDEPLSISPQFSHRIILDNPEVVYRKPYQLPVKYHQEVKDQVQTMLDQGIIRVSQSAYNNPLVPVVKRTGGLRLCLDFRNLNGNIRENRHPLPNINQLLCQLGRSKLFTTLDLRSGYWQIPLAEESKPLTAFSTPEGHYEFQVLPFGLRDAPGAYQRIVSSVLAGLTGHCAQVYLDDVVCLGPSFEAHVANLEKIIARLDGAGLSLRLSKCQFFSTEVSYLGFLINQEGIKPQPSKVAAIKAFPRPTTVRETLSFLGLASFYRRFIRGFSDKAAPLTALTKGGKDKKNLKELVDWGPEQQAAFDALKRALSEDIVVLYPDYSKEFYLTCDASDKALGGVLQQRDEQGHLRPLTYFSRTLAPSEVNYSAVEREALAVVYGFKVCRSIILGYKVIVQSDHRPLVWLFSTSSPTGKIARWQLAVAEHNVEVNYLPGKQNKVADCLSRVRASQEENVLTLNTGEYVVTQDELDLALATLERIRGAQQGYILAVQEGTDLLTWNLEDLMSCQGEDPDLQSIMSFVRDCPQTKPSDIPKDMRKLLHTWQLKLPDLTIQNGLLARRSVGNYGKELVQIVVPLPQRQNALKLAHSLPTAGHGGLHVTLERLHRFAYWPGMKSDVDQYIRSCAACLMYKPSGDAPAPYQRRPEVTEAWSRAHADLVGPLDRSTEGYLYILTVIDAFTRYLVTAPLRTKEAPEVARALVARVFFEHSPPKILVTDGGGEFCNKVLQETLPLLGVRKSVTCPYHPSANGTIERANATIVKILRTLVKDKPRQWAKLLPQATFAYNCAYNRAVGDSPYFLLKHKDPSMFIETLTPALSVHSTDLDKYKAEGLKTTRQIFLRCQAYLEHNQELQERTQKRNKFKNVQLGQRVYVKVPPAPGAPTKLQRKFDGPFRVIEIISPVAVKVKDLRTGRESTQHTNRIKVEGCMDMSEHSNVRRAFPLHDPPPVTTDRVDIGVESMDLPPDTLYEDTLYDLNPPSNHPQPRVTNPTKPTPTPPTSHPITPRSHPPSPHASTRSGGDVDGNAGEGTHSTSTPVMSGGASTPTSHSSEQLDVWDDTPRREWHEPRYPLRSWGTVDDLPLVMDKALEYQK